MRPLQGRVGFRVMFPGALSVSRRTTIFPPFMARGRISWRPGKSGQAPASWRTSGGQSVRVRLSTNSATHRLTETLDFRAAALTRRAVAWSRWIVTSAMFNPRARWYSCTCPIQCWQTIKNPASVPLWFCFHLTRSFNLGFSESIKNASSDHTQYQSGSSNKTAAALVLEARLFCLILTSTL